MSSAPTRTMVDVAMPQMGISVSEGTILEWRKAVGDAVAADETLCEITTDKIDVEIPCPATGTLAEILAEPGQTLPVGVPIARIETGAGASPAPNGAAPDAAGETSPRANGASEADRSAFVSPVVRRIATEHGVDVHQVEGHGVGGRVRKKDLLAHLEARPGGEPASERPSRPLHTESPYVPDAPATAPSEAGAGTRRAMTPMRKSIADHMVGSLQTSAHCTTIVEVDFSAVTGRRAELKEAYARRGVPLTYLAFVARAVVETLAEFPVLNSSVEGDELVLHDHVNLGIAVALDEGLIVPVIPDAQRLSLEGTAAAIADLAERARTKKLAPGDVQGGTFTITNPGQFGAVLATPIINQPQVAILDLEAIVKRAVVVGDAIAIRPMGFLPMSWDHRALDGAEAARFLGRVKERLETGGAS
ncbi:MAG: 2-oxo acid dehydrogenase subunit E2 [Actinomycetota bacterium]|nr:2-oxo acid dehydrogenase subunit E2 [Actinomycetota bacterium]